MPTLLTILFQGLKRINNNNQYLGQIHYDIPAAGNLYFQDPATTIAEELILFHDNLIFYLIVTSTGIVFGLISILTKQKLLSNFKLTHGSQLEIIWTIIPAIILIVIAIPSFRLLYMMDEIINPSLTIKATGFQWYWNYSYEDFKEHTLEFDSFCISDEDLEQGQLRLLEVDNSLIVPTNCHVRVITTSNDVIHSWGVPSLAARSDAIPGRLNSFSVLIKRAGIYRGNCYELCGSSHYKMPIVVEAVESSKFNLWLIKELAKN